MNIPLVCRHLGHIALLICGSMAFSLVWALPELGATPEFEWGGFRGLVAAMTCSLAAGGLLIFVGRKANGSLFRKEAMAIVGLSWVLATVLGALPFLFSGTSRAPDVKMTVADALFESQSGFSTTGATVLTDLEDPKLVARSILFWRSSTHFLGGLGIVVLFVVILGQGSAGKAMMRNEMPGPSQETPQARMQHAAWVLFIIYTALNALLTVLLKLEGLTWFDALCHAFGTMATGGFSTYNASVGHFETLGHNGALIESTIVVFMVLAGSNFMLMYFVVTRQPGKMLRDVEWRTYVAILAVAVLSVVAFGMWHRDFKNVSEALRYGAFQVVSIMTTTGYGTHDFDNWNAFGRGLLFLLMFVGGCAGSTGGGLKVIRHILFHKILWLEIERAFHPSVVRPLWLGSKPVEDQELRQNILVYFGLILVIFIFSWMFVVTVEPDATWLSSGGPVRDKLLDSASAVAATLNNIGPGLGTVGATHNYAHFSGVSKCYFVWLMMLGRLEIFTVLVLIVPGFWRSR